MTALPDRDDRTGWWHVLRSTYEANRQPHWREGLPSKSEEASQKRLWAVYFNSTYAREAKGDTTQSMAKFLAAYGRWIRTVDGDARTTCWGLLTRFGEGDGSLSSATPEAAIRGSLRGLSNVDAARLLLRIAADLLSR
ncbi:hypothetical protein [Cyanobium sp. N5-Cardenillas]|uniref:hypothetical protein n=1 Tax=Cyanobium sp. N5-Cardenillas TaxID=2823720 RepID=UPI0020CDC2A8|nr:hypothetical protein [Cyanobium sp. N5-Cardenillas]MCP9786004.1 hypothetical protein [Cyanobium sp. N5-Cardenillas]